MRNGDIQRVAMLGNHLPRQCGIATFTTDLSDAITASAPGLDCFVLAMNDNGNHHDYPPRVRFEIGENDAAAYRRAAHFLNVNAVDVVCVQHEYGIFGTRAGSNVLALLRELRMPVVTTLHTILGAPNLMQRRVMDELTELSDRLVVMTAHGAALLRDVHGVPNDKIDLIPHGIPSVPFDGQSSKAPLGIEGRPMLLTFGLLSPDKGIEHVIDALPSILARHPDTVYIVLGATHPHVRKHHGETYRLMLEDRARTLGVDGNVIFHNRFVSISELSEFLAAADIYITPYLNPEQITSGTLAYALGAGKAVISTPYVYARELLADDRGILVPWRDAGAIATEVTSLLDDDEKRLALRQRAAAHCRPMLWPAVARSYLESFERARSENARRLRTAFQTKTLAARPELPEVNLGHVAVMTDGTGIIQHAAFNVPRYADGYCLDDNARALLLMTLVEDAEANDNKTVRMLASRYLAFVSHAFNRPLGRFRNFMSYSRQWDEERGSEDSHGRALWALGTLVGRSGDPGRLSLAGELFHAALPAVTAFSSPRAWAFALLGIEEYLRAFGGDTSVQSFGRALAGRLYGLFQNTSRPDWPWFEDCATYCNARLSQALIASGSWMKNDEMLEAGTRSLDWLLAIQCTPDGYFAPIGTNGFYEKGTASALFDQQPVEASSTVSACLQAYRLTGDGKWLPQAQRAFNWYLGQNQLQQTLYDPLSGGCRDGLHADRMNENQGAESTLSFLLALTEMRANQSQQESLAAGDSSEAMLAVSTETVKNAEAVALGELR